MEEQNNSSPMNQIGHEEQGATPVAPNQTQAQPPTPPTEKSGGVGPMMGIVIIVILLIFGGLYFWGAYLNEQKQMDESLLFDPSLNEDITGSGDEPAQIESDLDAFDTADFEAQLEAELQEIESQL